MNNKEEYGNCTKCYLGYKGGCNMYTFWKTTDKFDHHRCKNFMTVEQYKKISWSIPSKGGTTESDLD